MHRCPDAKKSPEHLDCLKAAACAIILVAVSGCAVVKATQQPNKKDLGVLSRGVPRTHLIAELGAPAWSDERDGRITDVFAFKQGYSKPVKAGRALFHGAADVATCGLWEVVGTPVETLADGTDVQVAVCYDEHGNVDKIDVIRGEEAIRSKGLFASESPHDPARLAR